MSTFTFFSALEKLSDLDNDRNNNDNNRIVIPNYFLKLLLQNKTKLLKEQLNKKSVRELLRNRITFNNFYNEEKYQEIIIIQRVINIIILCQKFLKEKHFLI